MLKVKASPAAKSKLAATTSLTLRMLDQARVLRGCVLLSGNNHPHMSMA